jgi:predicted HicB family RNase H-like nuclease
MMSYKGYIARVEFDADANILHGEVINTRDLITFQGDTVARVKRAFHESVDDYLAFCESRGESPDKPFSGRFITRISPDLHREINVAAALAGKSLNAWVARKLAAAVRGSRSSNTAISKRRGSGPASGKVESGAAKSGPRKAKRKPSQA